MPVCFRFETPHADRPWIVHGTPHVFPIPSESELWERRGGASVYPGRRNRRRSCVMVAVFLTVAVPIAAAGAAAPVSSVTVVSRGCSGPNAEPEQAVDHR